MGASSRALGWVAVAFVGANAGCNRDVLLPPSLVCGEEQLAVGCTVGRCSVSAPRGTIGAGQVTVTENALPPSLAEDAVGPSICTLSFASTAPSGAAVTLAIKRD